MQECIKKIGEKLNCDDYMISMTIYIGENAAKMFEMERLLLKELLMNSQLQTSLNWNKTDAKVEEKEKKKNVGVLWKTKE